MVINTPFASMCIQMHDLHYPKMHGDLQCAGTHKNTTNIINFAVIASRRFSHGQTGLPVIFVNALAYAMKINNIKTAHQLPYNCGNLDQRHLSAVKRQQWQRQQRHLFGVSS
ncbi:hypothetical protein ACLKA6_002970 [Drosophila palustris]